MKAFYNPQESMNCIEALWYSAGAEEDELVKVEVCKGVAYIECDGDRIHVYDDSKDKTLLASFNAKMSMEFLSNVIEHMIYKLNN